MTVVQSLTFTEGSQTKSISVLLESRCWKRLGENITDIIHTSYMLEVYTALSYQLHGPMVYLGYMLSQLGTLVIVDHVNGTLVVIEYQLGLLDLRNLLAGSIMPVGRYSLPYKNINGILHTGNLII